MILIKILTALAALSLTVFAVPVRYKWIVALAVVLAGAVLSTAAAVGVLTDGAVGVPGGILAGGGEAVFTQGQSLLFGAAYAVIDPLSALFIIILSIAAVSVTVYARGYLAPYLDRKPPVQLSIHYFSLVAMYFSMLLVVMFRDGFGFLFSWELMTIASFLLILFDGERREVRRAAINYLILMHIGFVFLLIGFATLSANGLPASFDSLSLYFRTRPVIPLFVVFLVGFGMKAGVFPLHVWLPEAHPAAPSHISAFMSGVMIKMGIYGLLRVVSAIDNQLYTVGVILLAGGIVTGMWGVLLAALQNDMKKLLAYSSIENIGVILIGLGAGLMGKAGGNSLLALCGLGGALLHTVNHSFFKTLLFMGAGNVYASTHTTSIDSLGGVGKRMPVTGALFFVAVLAICAMPPLSGFVSEFLIYFGLIDALASGTSFAVAAIFGILFLALIGGLVVLAFTKLYGVVFLGSPRTRAAAHAREAGRSMLLGMAMPLAGVVVVGLVPLFFLRGVFDIVGTTFGIESSGAVFRMLSGDFARLSYVLLILAALTGLLWIVRRMVIRGRPVESGPTWGCGFTAPTARMQYSGESYSEGLQRISRLMTNNKGDKTISLGHDEIFPVSHNFEMQHEDRINSLFSAWWVELIRRINGWLNVLRTGKVNYYILYAILFFVLIFLLSVLKLI